MEWKCSFTPVRTCSALLLATALLCAAQVCAAKERSVRLRKNAAKPAIKSVALVNALTNKIIPEFTPLTEGATINLSLLAGVNLNLLAKGTSTVKRVRFVVDDKPYSVDKTTPFRIAENKQTKPARRKKKRRAAAKVPPAIWPLTVGVHSLKAVPFNARGKAGAPFTVTFTVIDELVVDASAPPLPKLAEWEANAIEAGRRHCDEARINEASTWEGNVWYYDGTRVYFQLADYTKDPSWYTCARYVNNVYRNYVLSSGGLLPGWRVFPHGLYEDYVRNKDEQSRQALLLLATKSAFAYPAGGPSYEVSRETAQIMMTYIYAEKLGQKLDPDIRKSADFALGHLQQWLSGGTDYVQPYLVALTLEALIAYQERTGDTRVLPAVRETAEWLWRDFWDAAKGEFTYVKCQPGATYSECGNAPSPHGDLNLLIVPVYGWLYRKTGDSRYQAMGDEVFQAGVHAPFLVYGKQFVQNYHWSFDYVRWRLGKK